MTLANAPDAPTQRTTNAVPATSPPTQHPTRGVLYAVSAAFGFALMGYFVHASDELSGAELAFWRGVVSTLVLLPVVRGEIVKLFRREGAWLWMRSLAGAGSVLCFFWTLQHSSIAAARALADMAPVFVCVLAWFSGYEKPSPAQLAMILLMTGSAVALQLGSVAAIPLLVTALGLFGGFSASLAYVALRRAARQFSSALVVLSLGIGLILIAPCVPGTSIHWPSKNALPSILWVGFFGVVAQMVFTRGFRHLSAPVASALSVTALLFSVLLDALVAGNRPTPLAMLAYGAIMFGAAALHFLESRKPVSEPEVTPDV